VAGDDVPDAIAGLDVAVVRALICSQFPQWSELPIKPVASEGTDNAMFRLGESLVVRLARRTGAVEPLAKEISVLPCLQGLPLATPSIQGIGQATDSYPFPWLVLKWIDGAEAHAEAIADWNLAASDLARFLVSLRALPTNGGPQSGAQNHFRGVPLSVRDRLTRRSIAQIGDLLDAQALLAVWEQSLAAPAWEGPPAWLHGDVHGGNLLACGGRLSAVIDFGLAAIGDPACDAMAAWTFLPASARDRFRAELGLNKADWVRGCGWALSTAVIALAYYRDTTPAMRASSTATLQAVLNDGIG
jgi:aminoglycoside phosphotransferase (APT) family kinase protein